jgi:XTP/dITP diphosphohydrolase
MQIVIATRNPGKFREISQIIAHPSLELLSLADLPEAPAVEETGETFEDNALLKARSAAYHAGCWALADDSGLVVPALSGAPGLRSARFAGENASDADNVSKVLEQLRETPGDQRQAEFVCCIALAGTNNRAFLAEGRLAGTIAYQPRGANGFGYDPIFLLPDRDRTMAELSMEEKNGLSHRTIALRKMVPLLLSLEQQSKTVC